MPSAAPVSLRISAPAVEPRKGESPDRRVPPVICRGAAPISVLIPPIRIRRFSGPYPSLRYRGTVLARPLAGRLARLFDEASQRTRRGDQPSGDQRAGSLGLIGDPIADRKLPKHRQVHAMTGGGDNFAAKFPQKE